MRVGIVTITELENFGNRLQNYALQTVLQNLGVEVETIPNYILYKRRKEILYKVKEVVKGLITLKRSNIVKVYKQCRFEKFDKKYFAFSQYFSTRDTISMGLSDAYDYFIAGSDQIWNPHFIFNFDFNFLTFTNKEKRIAYAPSFGVDKIPDSQRQDFKNWINGIETISVREFAGQEIIKNLTGRIAPVLIDPTLLLTKSDWEKIEKKPKWLHNNKEYILTYYLGSVENRKNVFEKLFKDFPEYRECNVIDIYNIKKFKQYAIAPDEFVWLVHNAKLMITDSFHGVVFSIIMKIPFIHANRKDIIMPMNSRIETLSKLLDMELSDSVVSKHIGENTCTDATIEALKDNAINYLKKSLQLS